MALPKIKSAEGQSGGHSSLHKSSSCKYTPDKHSSVKRRDRKGRRMRRTSSRSPSPSARRESRGGMRRKRTISHSSSPSARRERGGRTISRSSSPPARRKRGGRRTITRSPSPPTLSRRREMRKEEVNKEYKREERR